MQKWVPSNVHVLSKLFSFLFQFHPWIKIIDGEIVRDDKSNNCHGSNSEEKAPECLGTDEEIQNDEDIPKIEDMEIHNLEAEEIDDLVVEVDK